MHFSYDSREVYNTLKKLRFLMQVKQTLIFFNWCLMTICQIKNRKRSSRLYYTVNFGQNKLNSP